MESSPLPVLSSRIRSKTRAEEHSTLFQIAVIVFFVGALFLLSNAEDGARLTIELGDERRMFEGGVVEGMTVLDALNASVLAGQIPLRFVVDEDDQTRIFDIDGHERIDSEEDIVFYLNNTRIRSSDIHHISIKVKDEITVKLPPPGR